MHRFAPAALATLLAATAPALLSAHAPAQTSTAPAHFTDPANLRGERVSPRTGRELPIDQGTLGLEELLRKLNTRASILNIVAHPDDEDGGMLTLYSRGYGARVADLSLTRGEGGQNAATSDFDDALGLLRTQELLSNDRYTGVTQMFGTEVDFGFSKTKAESFSKWGHDRVLYDAVRAIRLFRPLVITATFIGNPTDGHGQHQVSGQIAQEAFKAAGDPSIFPELTKEGILPWQPLKMYARAPMQSISPKGLFDYATGQYAPAQFTNYVTGVTSATPPAPDITIHEGTTDPLITTCAANPSDLPSALRAASNSSNLSSRPALATTLSSRPERSGVERPASLPASATDCRPLSYVLFARIGLGLQRTQIGPGVRNARAGAFDVPYHLYFSCVNPSPASEKICHLDRSLAASSQGAAERPASPPAAALPSDPPSHDPQQAPTARNIPAWGAAPGHAPQENPRAEGPLYNPALISQPNFFDGIDTSIEGIATLAPDAKRAVPIVLKTNLSGITQKIESAQKEVSEGHTDYAANDLATALTIVDSLIKNLIELKPDLLPLDQKENVLHELRIKRVQLDDALVLALGLHFDATSSADDLPVGVAATVHTVLTTDTNQRIPWFTEEIQTVNGTLQHGPTIDGYPAVTRSRPWIEDLAAKPEFTRTETRPYFFRDNIEQPTYQLRNASLRNAPATPPALVAWANLTYNGTDIHLGRVVESKSQPVQFVPAYSLSLTAGAQVLPASNPTLLLGENVVPFMANANFKIEVPAGWHVHPHPQANPSNERTWSFDQITVDHAPRKPVTIPVSVSSLDGRTYTEGFRPVGYGDLPRTNIYTPATDRIVPVDLKLPPPDK
ncbi:MAG TPA: PIG-L family deacetylase, partial [Acidobacteriaceae bacterium]